MESFLRQFEKAPGFKPAFEFKRKMQASARSLQTSMVPLFHLADQLNTIKAEAERTVTECGAEIVPKGAAGSTFLGWGQESVQAVLRPLSSGPKVVSSLGQSIKLDDLGLSDSPRPFRPGSRSWLPRTRRSWKERWQKSTRISAGCTITCSTSPTRPAIA